MSRGGEGERGRKGYIGFFSDQKGRREGRGGRLYHITTRAISSVNRCRRCGGGGSVRISQCREGGIQSQYVFLIVAAWGRGSRGCNEDGDGDGERGRKEGVGNGRGKKRRGRPERKRFARDERFSLALHTTCFFDCLSLSLSCNSYYTMQAAFTDNAFSAPTMDPISLARTLAAEDKPQKAPPPPAVIRPYDATKDLKYTRYLVGSAVMEPYVSVSCRLEEKGRREVEGEMRTFAGSGRAAQAYRPQRDIQSGVLTPSCTVTAPPKRTNARSLPPSD